MNIGTIIPQIFYDLIARITPGLTVILSILVVWERNNLSVDGIAKVGRLLAKESFPTLPVASLLVLCAYILAFILDGVGTLSAPKAVFSRLFLQEADGDTEKICADFAKLDPKYQGATIEFPGVPLRYDAVRLRDPNAGARLAKMRAELHMLRILGIGASLVGLLNLKNLPGHFIETLVSTSSIVLVIWALSKTHNRLHGRFVWGTCNHWLLLVNPGSMVGLEVEKKVDQSTRPDGEKASALPSNGFVALPQS